MANKEINDLTPKVTPLSTDEVEIQATGGGASAKVTLANVSKAIFIPASQVTDFDTEVANNSAVTANTDKTSYPGASATETLTNKTIDGDNNTIRDISSESLKNTVAFHAYHNTTQSIGSGFTAMSFNTELFDRGGDFASNVFTAPQTGIYFFNARWHTASAPQRVLMSIYVDSGSGYAEAIRGVDISESDNLAPGIGTACSGIVSLTAGDTVRAYGFCNTSVNAVAGQALCYFQGYLIGS